jgi:predicted molibdopterin-dependent oxidoreductase YjgC
MMDLEKPKIEAPPPVDAPELRIAVPRGPLPVTPPQAAKKTVEISIDGQTLSVPEGTTLLDAARSLAIDTPTLCYLENLTPVNVCRICVVELEGSRTLVPACSRKAEPGMVVKTDSERVRLSRRLVLELLSSSVDVSTAPQLQSYMKRYAAEPERFGCSASVTPGAEQPAGGLAAHVSAATVDQPVKIDNELYVRDYGKCILCYKCVEACGKDAQNTFAIAVAGRGFNAHISTEYEIPLPDSACVYCGNCIGVCPTGALMFRSEYEMRLAGTWDEQQQKQTDTICPYCGVGCTLTLHVQENNIVRVTSPLDQDVTHGHLCIKGRFGWQFVQNRKAEPKKTE